MEIISLTGKSGTGKSYHANRLCIKMNIEAIIDDGLLIYKNRIVAGTSAKRGGTKAAAMRATLFEYHDQRDEVMAALSKYDPEKLLIIGTSDRMVDWITDALGLPRADKRVYIEDITTPEERAEATRVRNERGEHIIPAPIGQLKREFAGYFINPARVLKGMTMGEGPLVQGQALDRTVVRPTYSYYGNFQISEKCISDIIDIAMEQHREFLDLMGFFHNGNAHNLGVVIEVRIGRGAGIIDHCRMLQREVIDAIEAMASFQVGLVNIEIKDIRYKDIIITKRKLKRSKPKKDRKRTKDNQAND